MSTDPRWKLKSASCAEESSIFVASTAAKISYPSCSSIALRRAASSRLGAPRLWRSSSASRIGFSFRADSARQSPIALVMKRGRMSPFSPHCFSAPRWGATRSSMSSWVKRSPATSTPAVPSTRISPSSRRVTHRSSVPPPKSKTSASPAGTSAASAAATGSCTNLMSRRPARRAACSRRVRARSSTPAPPTNSTGRPMVAAVGRVPLSSATRSNTAVRIMAIRSSSPRSSPKTFVLDSSGSPRNVFSDWNSRPGELVSARMTASTPVDWRGLLDSMRTPSALNSRRAGPRPRLSARNDWIAW